MTTNATSTLDRPVVSDLEDGPAGRSFTVRFKAHQTLPTHQNASRVVITAVRGDGTIMVGDQSPRLLHEGGFVQLDPNVPHAVVAGADGLELLVVLAPTCCGAC